MLLIDDVQFLEGKARTADEFFHTFNALHEGGAQLVLTADRVPSELSALAERLRDRFEWGLTVPVEPPDLRTRLIFLGNLAREQTEQLPPEALRALAAKRRRQPAPARGRADPRRRPLLADRIRRSPPSPSTSALPARHGRAPPAASVDVDEIQDAVAARLDVTVEQMLSPTRTAPRRPGAPARHVPDPRAHRPLPPRDRRRPSTAAITPPSSTRSASVERSALEDAGLSRTLDELTAELRSAEIDRDRTD